MRMLTLAGLIAGLAGLSATGAASAQWGIAAEIGVTRFGGSSRDTSGTAVGPYRPTTFELRLARGRGAVRGRVCVLAARTPFAGEQPGLAFVQSDFASVWEIAPQLSFRVARFGVGVDVRLEAGPAVQRWSLDGDRRARLASRTAAALEWPLARALTGSLRVSGVLSGSVFNAGETPAGVGRRATRRIRRAIGPRDRL